MIDFIFQTGNTEDFMNQLHVLYLVKRRIQKLSLVLHMQEKLHFFRENMKGLSEQERFVDESIDQIMWMMSEYFRGKYLICLFTKKERPGATQM